MSILIKGMEMPKACMECPIETDYGTCGYYSLYVEAGHESDCEKRRDDCPLIEIPTPHGRLIDASALEREISRWIPHPDKYINKRNSDFLYYIKDTETVIEAEPPKEETK